MAKADVPREIPLNEQQLAELRDRFAKLSLTGLYDAYHAAWSRCRLEREQPPPRAAFIQELVQAWRELRKIK